MNSTIWPKPRHIWRSVRADKPRSDVTGVRFFTRPLRPRPQFRLAALRAPAHITFRKDGCAMGDAVAVLYGIFVFVLLMLYVRGCEKV